MASHTDFVQYFANHFVSIVGLMERPDGQAIDQGIVTYPYTASAFVMSVRGYWFLVTAGHVLDQIEQWKREGYIFREWSLDDTWGSRSKWNHRIPFDFDPNKVWHIDEDGLDCALIPLRHLYGEALAKNGIRPLDQLAWRVNIPDVFDAYYILGLPTQLEQIEAVEGGVHFNKSLVLLPVEKIDEPPEDVRKEWPCFYGKIADYPVSYDENQLLYDIKGMSGGPIFGFKDNRYWLIAIQSSWYKSRRIIVGSSIKELAEHIEERLRNESNAV